MLGWFSFEKGSGGGGGRGGVVGLVLSGDVVVLHCTLHILQNKHYIYIII